MDGDGFIGKEIGNYRITREINSGAYGSVYQAEHIHLKERVVAIKLLHTYMGSSQEREQFAQEAQFLALLEHSHILPLLDFGFNERRPYLIARYAAGGSLRDLLKRQAPLPIEQAVSILTQVGQALHYAHQRQIIHRDLKPENILFNTSGDALLADFGIATMLSTASVKHLTTIGGTPPYMAPEQFQGTISKEGDQYALGCIAYELVTGHLPFTAPDFLSMGFKHLTEQPARPTRHNPQVPGAIEAAILKAMAKQRGERHTDISAFVAALRAPFTRAATLLPGVLPISSIQPTILASATVPTSQEQTKEQWIEGGDEHFKGKRYTEALLAYKQAIHLDPNFALAHYSKGVALTYLKRYKEALVAFEQVIRLDPNFALAHNKGVALANLGRYKEALVAFEQAIRLNPKDALAHYSKGVALAYLKRDEEALMAFEQAIRLDPKDALIHRDKGVTLEDLKRYEQALAAYEQAIRLNPKDALAHYSKGDMLKQLGRRREAQQAYKKAQQLTRE